jgi:hypothetical protein
MEPARRVHIVKRDGKDESSEQPGDEAREAALGRFGTSAQDMVTLVDRVEEGLQMIRGFALGGGGDEYQGQLSP